MKTLLPNGLSTFFINGEPTFINGLRKLRRKLPDCTILDSWVFDDLILADKLFAKVLRGFETYLSVIRNLCWKLVSSLESPNVFDESFRITSVAF